MQSSADGIAQTNYQRTYSFGPLKSLGNWPRGNLLQASDGAFYGITYGGGSNQVGTIYTIMPDGTGHQVLHHFSGSTLFPVAGLVEASGSLYGTMPSGGSSNVGVIFKIGKNGSGYTIMREFQDGATDGSSPLASLLLASDGLLYGTTAGGGSSNMGTIFRINPSGANYSVRFNFSETDGKYPSAALIQGNDGALYGTTRLGGTNGQGVVFKINRNGSGYTVLHHFSAIGSDGREPMAELLQGDDGFLYGSTLSGGSASAGTLFKVNTDGTGFSTLHQCAYQANNGAEPLCRLTKGAGGVLYGTMPRGGIENNGIAFQIRTNGTGFSVLHLFGTAGGDGMQPYSPLLLASDGVFYGSTFNGGDYVQSGIGGTIFKLSFEGLPGKLHLTAVETGVKLNFENGVGAKTYVIERTPTLSPAAWQGIGTTPSLANGSFEFIDEDPLDPSGFYRVAPQ